MFTRINHILPETVKKNGMAPKVARARVFSLFENAARARLPDDAAESFKVLRLADGTLTVACRSSATASALRTDAAALLEAVKEAGADRIQFLLSPWR